MALENSEVDPYVPIFGGKCNQNFEKFWKFLNYANSADFSKIMYTILPQMTSDDLQKIGPPKFDILSFYEVQTIKLT